MQNLEYLYTLKNSKEDFGFLYGLKKFYQKPNLIQINLALNKLGNFHKKFRVIHITGTNGKGSTAAMIANILKISGLNVGLYTSPHLVSFNERIQVNGISISNIDAFRIIEEIKSLNIELSFFEFTTLLALLYFKEQKTDFIVLEVGMGGTWDATNVCDAEISVITPIDLDHTHILGNSVEKITRDKCGIIKEKTKTVTCINNNISIIKEYTKKNPLIIAKKYSGEISLNGDFQKINAGMAEKVCKFLGIDEKFIIEGIKTVDWPGRMEFIEKNILLDCAHNPYAIKSMADFVKKQKFKKLILVLGLLGDKDIKGIIKNLPKQDILILTKPKIERALDPEKIAEKGKFFEYIIIDEPIEALRYAKKIADFDDLILVTGSCYLIGNIKEAISKEKKF
jgi:dihydrofolate synthase / folylpolyglutamate synthase